MTDSTPGAAPAAPLTPAEDKQWASFAHFGGVLLFVPSLIIFLVFKDRGRLARQESKEALNFQITYLIAWVALSIVVSFLGAGDAPVSVVPRKRGVLDRRRHPCERGRLLPLPGDAAPHPLTRRAEVRDARAATRCAPARGGRAAAARSSNTCAPRVCGKSA
jgi:hypothetical protein